MDKEKYGDIPAEKFRFVNRDDVILDKPPETKPQGNFRRIFSRFMKFTPAVVSVIILLIIGLYSIVVPMIYPDAVSEHDLAYAYALPKLGDLDLGFWNGCTDRTLNIQRYDLYSSIPGAVRKVYYSTLESYPDGDKPTYRVSVDSYAAVGFKLLSVDKDEYERIKAYESSSGKQVLYPLRDTDKVKCQAYGANENAWFLTDEKGIALRGPDGQLQNIYLTDPTSPDGYMYAQSRQNGSHYTIRVLYREYYNFEHGKYASFLFGADEFGYDIFVRLASGGRVSLSLSVGAALINLILGIIIGAIEGYYGGAVDLLIERFKDIVFSVPSVIFITLFQLYIGASLGALPAMFICFIFFGWAPVSSTVRAQFYRFKGREYVLASRTLGASDRRLIFKHILPNASGFIITSVVLGIPGIIFGEATYTYLGIVNLNSKDMTSIGTMLENGQSTLSSYPHCVLFPALLLSVMLICMNNFGNGLRDAVDPVSK